MTVDPVKVAFSLSEPTRYAKPTGRCARCASPGHLTQTREVVSPTFTGFDGWIGPTGGLCPACVWLYTTTSLRNLPHLVSQAPSFAAVSLAEVYVILSQGPLKPSCALSIPLRPGRKHLFADARWGTIRTDDANLTWSPADADRLATIRQLRGMGFTPRQIAEPAPDYDTLRRHPAHLWSHTQRAWESLAPWRSATHWLALGLTITKGMR